MAAKKVATSMPAIRAMIGHIPQRLKTQNIAVERGRLQILRRLITRLVREERYELALNRAVEARPYMERLLQLAIYRGVEDEYTNEMIDWWLAERDLRDKFLEVLVPRFREQEEPFTEIYRLPNERLEYFVRKKNIRWHNFDIAILELKGNPFPPVMAEPVDNSASLLNILLKNALRQRVPSKDSSTS